MAGDAGHSSLLADASRLDDRSRVSPFGRLIDAMISRSNRETKLHP
jgi:hypothetical protein